MNIYFADARYMKGISAEAFQVIVVHNKKAIESFIRLKMTHKNHHQNLFDRKSNIYGNNLLLFFLLVFLLVYYTHIG